MMIEIRTVTFFGAEWLEEGARKQSKMMEECSIFTGVVVVQTNIYMYVCVYINTFIKSESPTELYIYYYISPN